LSGVTSRSPENRPPADGRTVLTGPHGDATVAGMAITRGRPVHPFRLVVVAWFFLASITPSLVPRSWYLQALTSGISMAYGYGLGTILEWVGHRAAALIDLHISVSPTARRLLRIVGWSLLGLILVAVWLWSLAWQRQTARLVGLAEPGWGFLLLGLVGSFVVFGLLILFVRGLRALVRRSSRAGRRFVSPVVATPIAVVLVALLVVFVSNSVLYQSFMTYTADKAALLNASTPAGRTQPTSPLRSGSTASAESWKSLGRNGQGFVADGSTGAAIAAATGRPALEPIRVYAGLTEGRSLDQVADAVVAELHRTRAFDRDVLAVMTTTGRGWVDEWSASSIEYLTNGNSAIAAMQYSYLPSPVALIADRRTPATAGKTLFGKVYAEWSKLPIDQRPRLVAGGESLGAFGGQSAFTSIDDMLLKLEGAVWVGTPNFTPVWRDLTEDRQGGSPEIAPVINGGLHVRFATRPAELTRDIYGRPFRDWKSPRVVYAQHASDPITWWSADLLLEEPDWLRERVGRDVNDMRWASFASFWQLTTDLMVANATPPGHGHRFQEELVPAWAAVLGHDPEADYTRIRDAIRTDYEKV
jgi:uncharacterized membrane protein